MVIFMKKILVFIFILITGFVILFFAKGEQAKEKQMIQNTTEVTSVKEKNETGERIMIIICGFFDDGPF